MADRRERFVAEEEVSLLAWPQRATPCAIYSRRRSNLGSPGSRRHPGRAATRGRALRVRFFINVPVPGKLNRQSTCSSSQRSLVVKLQTRRARPLVAARPGWLRPSGLPETALVIARLVSLQ